MGRGAFPEEHRVRCFVWIRLNGLTKEMETVRASSGGGGGGGGKVGGREGEGGGEGHVRSRLMMLEQRTEQQERETSTLKVIYTYPRDTILTS